ncbi:MAG: hypothetical protein H7211_09645 [Aquabacterium sp.]|nr:hypothetical protein [Ferruginibacter sp.]
MNYLIQTVLSSLCQLTIVEDVFFGMQVVREKKDIGLVIVDIDYQTKEVLDFISHINSSKLYKKPLIILSNSQREKLHKPLIENFIYGYFIKPFNPIELVKTINELKNRMSVSG